jgi:hypothetical protein
MRACFSIDFLVYGRLNSLAMFFVRALCVNAKKKKKKVAVVFFDSAAGLVSPRRVKFVFQNPVLPGSY